MANPFYSILKACWCERKRLPSNVKVRYLYQPGKLKGQTKRTADPIWSLKFYTLERAVANPKEPTMYYLHHDPQRAVGCPAKHTAASRPCHVKLEWLGVNPIWMHPESVVIRARSQLLLLISCPLSVDHMKSSRFSAL